jgi:hypothetical protein
MNALLPHDVAVVGSGCPRGAAGVEEQRRPCLKGVDPQTEERGFL